MLKLKLRGSDGCIARASDSLKLRFKTQRAFVLKFQKRSVN